jgi:hypothetical protein
LTYERQLPSHGLEAEQICYSLREFGFGSRLYSQSTIKNNSVNGDENKTDIYSELEFKRLLGYYIESGIPIILAITNERLGHALVIIGHKAIDHSKLVLEGFGPIEVSCSDGQNRKLYDYSDFIEQYIAIDDNMPPYNLITYNNPVCNYPDPDFANCRINSFIVPLYHKIYLEAGGAKELTLSYISKYEFNLPTKDIIFKLFYTSSRSFKSELNKDNSIGSEVKDLILTTAMPKFIWVTILTNIDLLREGKANGLILLDATEPNPEGSLILMASPSCVIIYDPNAELNEKHDVFELTVDNFTIFANNLKKAD